jgi:DNA repair exonuclease SbcCD ATPase subunit
MIKSLHIKNIQSHRDTLLDFAAGVNVIVGSSDSGKSAVLRALLWPPTNRPTGDAFRSTWGGDASVEIKTDNKAAVTRIKAGKRNAYVLGDQPDNIAFEAVGAGDPPAEILAALNLADVNVQRQMDSPFLLSSEWTPGRVAEYLNEAAGLDAIDRATANIEAVVRKNKADLENEKAALKNNEAKFAALDYVDALDARVKAVESIAGQVTRTRAGEQALNAAVVDIRSIQAQINALPDYSVATTRVTALIKVLGQADALDVERNQLQAACDTVDSAQADLAIVRATTAAEPVFAAAMNARDASIEADEHRSMLRRAVADIRETQAQLAVVEKTTRAARLVNHTIETDKACETADNLWNEIKKAVGNITDIEAAIALNAGHLRKLEDGWHNTAPDICPLCEGKGRLT